VLLTHDPTNLELQTPVTFNEAGFPTAQAVPLTQVVQFYGHGGHWFGGKKNPEMHYVQIPVQSHDEQFPGHGLH